MTGKLLAKNRKAHFDYELHEKFVAGLVLAGHEVKSIRRGNANLKGSFITLQGSEAWLTNAHITLYEFANNISGYSPTQPRKLLLSKKELAQLARARDDEKLTVVPLALLAVGPHIKIKIAIARGKRHADKRQTIRTRDINREAARELSKH